MTIVRIQLKVF